MDDRYLWFEERGVSFSPFTITWFTSNLNKYFVNIARKYPKVCFGWFSVGAGVGLLTVVGAELLLLLNVWHLFAAPTAAPPLTPVIPGVNVPWAQMGYYLGALLVCGIVHEAGHAIAAASEGVGLRGFGIFFMGFYPGAFVELAEGWEEGRPGKLLRVVCAGAWHNWATAGGAVGLAMLLPFVLTPVYSHGPLAVAAVPTGSPLESFVKEGLVLRRVDDCVVHDREGWVECLIRESEGGWCSPESLPPSPGSTSLWFTSVDRSVNVSLGVQKVMTLGRKCAEDSTCHEGERCWLPLLEPELRLFRLEFTDSSVVTFLGSPGELFGAGENEKTLIPVRWSEYQPRALVSWLLSPELPLMLERFLHYLTSFSAAFAVLNLAPGKESSDGPIKVFYLDGSYAAEGFFKLFFPRTTSSQKKRILKGIFTGTAILFGVNLGLGMYYL